MLKKGQPVKFSRPMSTMRVVLLAVENGIQSKMEIVDDTKLNIGQVQSALWNLCYIGAITRATDAQGRSVYLIPGRHYGVAQNLLGVRSIFDVR